MLHNQWIFKPAVAQEWRFHCIESYQHENASGEPINALSPQSFCSLTTSAVQQQKYFRGAAQASLSQCGAVQFSLYNKAFFTTRKKLK